MMDQERERIFDDLRGLVAGDVRCDDLTLAMFSSDASVHQVRPSAVVCPRNVEAVAATVKYAAERGLAVHPRGAGTGLAGGALGPGIVIDFSRYMHGIVDLDGEPIRVKPGAVLSLVNERLRRRGRKLGPDPANGAVTTLGSFVAVDASGSRWLKYGSARHCVRELEVVLADGTVLRVGKHRVGTESGRGRSHAPQAASEAARIHPSPVDSPQATPLDALQHPLQDRVESPMHAAVAASSHEPTVDALVARVASILAGNAALIEQYQPRGGPSRGGYRLNDVLVDDELDLARLLCGSQGTLAIITEATLATVPLPQHVGVALLMFDRLESALQAVPDVVALGAAACDLVDRRHLTLARESDVRYDLLIPATIEAVLVVECKADTAAALRDMLAAITIRLRRELRLAIDARQTLDRDECELYWRLATRVVPRLYRLAGSTQAVPFVEDVVIPVPALADFLVRLQNVLKHHQVTASVFGHAGHGRLHVRPFLDLTNPADVARMQPLADDLYHEVFAVGGAIGGELGDGLGRTSFLRRQYGPLYDVMTDIKRAFDPQNVLNPGHVIGDDPLQLTRHLRPTLAASLPLQLAWSNEEVFAAARHCNGCGACRTQLPGERMCPIFRIAPREEASPRAKANLMRAMLAGQLDPGLLPSDELKRVADLCVHCHQCRAECPANVDIPRLMVEAKAAHVAHNGLKPSDWFISRLDVLARFGAVVRPVTNWALGNRVMRWSLEKLFGIAQGRKLPRLARRTFLRTAARRKLHRPNKGGSRKVAYFVDTYANHFDPVLGEALVAVLRHNGVEVFVPLDQEPAQMALVALGAVTRARRFAARNVSLLAEAVRQGYHIVATEPSAALCLVHEYPLLVDDDEAELVAANSSEACTFLWRMHQQGQLRLDFHPLHATVGYHQPCHLRALGVGSPGEHLLRLIPGLTVLSQDTGCSGMAGTFGLKRENYRSSLRAGWPLIARMRDPVLMAGTTECSTCKMQMEQGTTKPTIHPLKLLALAYGLMPQLRSLLGTRGQELLVT